MGVFWGELDDVVGAWVELGEELMIIDNGKVGLP